MLIHILPENDTVKAMYEGHGNFHPGDSGLDLFVVEDIVIPGGSRSNKIDLNIKCEAFPSQSNMGVNISYYLYPRSSISKTPLRLCNSVGIIDSGYRGNIMAFVDNIDDEDYRITAGTRLFQICDPTLNPITMSVVNSLSETSRGTGGFGSTGA